MIESKYFKDSMIVGLSKNNVLFLEFTIFFLCITHILTCFVSIVFLSSFEFFKEFYGVGFAAFFIYFNISHPKNNGIRFNEYSLNCFGAAFFWPLAVYICSMSFIFKKITLFKKNIFINGKKHILRVNGIFEFKFTMNGLLHREDYACAYYSSKFHGSEQSSKYYLFGEEVGDKIFDQNFVDDMIAGNFDWESFEVEYYKLKEILTIKNSVGTF